MGLDDEGKPARADPRQTTAAGKQKLASVQDDLVGDVVFDLIDEVDEVAGEDTLNDVFARDTAIPASPSDELAAERMHKFDADVRLPNGRNNPRIPPPPPMRAQQLTPITLEPPSADLEFDGFDAPIDVFGQQLPGTRPAEGAQRPNFGQSQMPTAPPAAAKGLLDQSKRSSPAPQRAQRPAFLAETRRNRPIDPQLLARATAPASTSRSGSRRGGAGSYGSQPSKESALDFVDGLDPLLESLPPAPKSGLKAPAPPASATRAGAKEMHECYALGDFTQALHIAEELLARSPDDISARRCAQNCRDVLTQMYAARIGPLDQVMTVTVSPEEVQWLALDHRAGFLLALVDGQSTVDEILDISGMTRLDALKIIFDLVERQVVSLA